MEAVHFYSSLQFWWHEDNARKECFRTYHIAQNAQIAAVCEGPSTLALHPRPCHSCRNVPVTSMHVHHTPCWCRSGPVVSCRPFPESLVSRLDTRPFLPCMAKWIVFTSAVLQIHCRVPQEEASDQFAFLGTKDSRLLAHLQENIFGPSYPRALLLRRFTCNYTTFVTKIQRVWRRYKSGQICTVLSACTPIAHDVIARVIVGFSVVDGRTRCQ